MKAFILFFALLIPVFAQVGTAVDGIYKQRSTQNPVGGACNQNVILLIDGTPPFFLTCYQGVWTIAGSASSGGTWGSITGTLSTQTDLFTAFAALSSAPTFTGSVSAPAFLGTGTTPQTMELKAGTGSISALSANSAGLSAPDTGGTAYRWKMPGTSAVGFPLVGATNTTRGVTEAPITINKWITAVTGSIGGSAITPGTPLSSTVTATGAAVGDFCYMAPSTGALNAGIIPYCFISATNTVTWYLQAQGASPVTPTAQVYNLRVN